MIPQVRQYMENYGRGKIDLAGCEKLSLNLFNRLLIGLHLHHSGDRLEEGYR